MKGYTLSAMTEATKSEGWREAGVPVTYFSGGSDMAFPVEKQRESIARLREAGVEVKVVEREGWDHSPFLAHAGEIKDVVVDTLEGRT